MKRYDEYESVEELFEAYDITPLSKFITEKKDDIKSEDDPEKVIKTDTLEVNYAEIHPKKFNNIFKRIFNNTRSSFIVSANRSSCTNCNRSF